ncbi:hypothetical protein CKM354_000849600 [Cercospora kikuchii]|uniref:Carbonyl reductase n=1 Tax=Cercospora kikuchii TaxID=84275 RepID=A0A9P3CM79_9PEZI|nr:uncharacterized protein CKM354_000849600 [Cercospora kikuchii]GIZ45323.1 hypothetical protein CKM354_000849600 [Cercospora kikuchii]
MVNPRVVIVTGANRGIGRAVCDKILSKPNVGPIKLFATSRKGDDLAIKAQSPDQKILYPKLDISVQDSIRDFGVEVQKLHGPVSVLVNNAGVNLDQPAKSYGPENAKKTLDINYRGTLQMCQTFLPQLSDGGRIVNLSSIASSINTYSPEIQQRLRSATTFEELEQIAQEFEHSVRTSTEASSGFHSTQRSYNVSKALLRAATRILASQNPQQLINCCCPGWIDTDMGGLISSRGTRPPKTAEEGARIPVRLALDDIGGVTGEHWANDSVRSREEGKVMKDWEES